MCAIQRGGCRIKAYAHTKPYSFCAATKLDYEWSPFFLRDSRASEARARVKITPREKGETRRGERKNEVTLSPPRLAFLARGNFHARSRFACATIPEEKWGLLHETTKFITDRTSHCGGAISVTKRSCAAPISKVESHILDRCSYYSG